MLPAIRKQIPNLHEFARKLADDAAPDFQRQAVLSERDLVKPLELSRLPDEPMFSSGAFDEFFDLVCFAVYCSPRSWRNGADALRDLYAASMAMVGVCYYQRPESAEFSFEHICRLLALAARACEDVPQEEAVRFVEQCHQQFATTDFWEPVFVQACLLATHAALSTRLPQARQSSNRLTSCLQSTELQQFLTSPASADPQRLKVFRELVEMSGNSIERN